MKQNSEMNIVAKFEGDWVRIEEVMKNPKNRQMWDLCIRGNLGSKMGLIIKRTNNKFCKLEFKNQ